jgi:hypothetical protein
MYYNDSCIGIAVWVLLDATGIVTSHCALLVALLYRQLGKGVRLADPATIPVHRECQPLLSQPGRVHAVHGLAL